MAVPEYLFEKKGANFFFSRITKNKRKRTNELRKHRKYKKLAGQAGVANASYVQLAHLVMDSQKISFIETQTRGSKQKV